MVEVDNNAQMEASFEDSLLADQQDLDFVRYYRQNGCCWRCIFLMFN